MKTTEIDGAVAAVLRKAAKGKIVGVAKSRGKPEWLTAYEILEHMDEKWQEQVIAEYGLGGKGHGHPYAATSFVADAAERVDGVRKDYCDVRGMKFVVAGVELDPGVDECGIYWLDPADDVG